MVRLCRLWLFRRDAGGGVLSDRQLHRIAAGHIRRLWPCLSRAAVGCDRRRRLHRPRRPQERPDAVDRADDDRHDDDGDHTGLCDHRSCRTDHHHDRPPVAGIFGRRRVRQRRYLSSRAWRPAPRFQRQLAICHRRHDHGSRLAVRRNLDDVADTPAAGRLGLADPLFLWSAARPRRALYPRESGGNAGVSRGR